MRSAFVALTLVGLAWIFGALMRITITAADKNALEKNGAVLSVPI
jgi:hypothetical protein